MAKWAPCTDEKRFPEPHRYLLWKDRRSYAIYPSLSLVKQAISYGCKQQRQGGAPGKYVDITTYEFTVFEWDGTRWQEIYKIDRNAVKQEHPLWKNGAAPKHKMTVSDEDVAAAIASITGTSD